MRGSQSRERKNTGGAAAVLVKVVLIALLVYAGVALYQVQGKIQTAEAQLSSLSEQKQSLEDKNSALRADINAADDPEKLEEIARNKLGMVKSGEKVFYDTGY